MELPIRITDGKDPDTEEVCKVLEINGKIVPFWIENKKIQEIADKIKSYPQAKNPMLIRTMDSFLSLVANCINKKVTLSELMSAVEIGVIAVGPPPKEKL